MSEVAILTAVPQYLIDNLSDWTTDNCKANLEGRPYPIQGDLFASTHIREVQTKTKADHGNHEEIYGFDVTITKRIKAVPYTKLTEEHATKELTGLYPVLNRIKYAIHNRWSVVNAINDAITTDDPELNQFIISECFVTTIIALRISTIVFQEEEWFHGEHGKDPITFKDGYTGISVTIPFGNLEKHTILEPEVC